MIHVAPHNGEVMVYPGRHLGDRFQLFIACCHAVGSRYDGETKMHYVNKRNAFNLVARLRLDFDVDIDSALIQYIQDEQIEIDKNHARIDAAPLFPFQSQGSKWLISRDRALLADDMGLGKTVQALMALPEEGRIIVVCPASVKGVWMDECKRWRPDLQPIVISGRGHFIWPQKGQLVILNYELLPDTKFQDLPSTTLIADEAHYLKGKAKVKRVKLFRILSKEVLTYEGRVWLLTGTPMPNSPPELWNVLNAARLHKEAFGDWNKFKHVFNGYDGAFGLVWGAKPKKNLAAKALSEVMLRRKRIKVLPDLPIKLYRSMTVEIGERTKRLCNEVVEELTGGNLNLIAKAIESSMGNRGAKIKFEKLSKARMELATAKIPHAVSLIETYEEANEPVVLFTDHRSVTEVFGRRKGWHVIDGGVPAAKRTDIVDEFQSGSLKGMALTIGAGGIGLTLTRAHHAVFVDLRWTPEDNAQAEDRLCRIGQDRGVVITNLVADHDLDRHIHAVLKKKQQLIEATFA